MPDEKQKNTRDKNRAKGKGSKTFKVAAEPLEKIKTLQNSPWRRSALGCSGQARDAVPKQKKKKKEYEHAKLNFILVIKQTSTVNGFAITNQSNVKSFCPQNKELTFVSQFLSNSFCFNFEEKLRCYFKKKK